MILGEVYLVQLSSNEILHLHELLLWIINESSESWTANETDRQDVAKHILGRVRNARDRVKQFPAPGTGG